MSKPIIKCLCGKPVTANTFKTHVKSINCSLIAEEKRRVLNILNIKTKNQFAWLKSEGPEAVLDKTWHMSVILKITELDMWTMKSPRKKGVNRPSHLKQSAIDRLGRGNPVSKTKPVYNKIDIIKYCQQYKEDLLAGRIGTRQMIKIIEKQYPCFQYNWVSDPEKKLTKENGYIKINAIISEIFDINIKTIKNIILKHRGMGISKGQLASEKFMKFARSQASTLLSSWRVTKPQRRLFEMVKKYDKNAKLEYRIEHERRFYSYDIYSPKINALIEMHGHIWHDPKYAPKSFKDMVDKNLKNDIVKKSLADAKGYILYIFWDNNEESWEDSVRRIYENKENITG